MLGRQASRATCRQGYCLTVMPSGKGPWHAPGVPITGDSLPLVLGGLESPNVASQVTRFQRARRPSTCIFAAQCTLGLWTCSFLTAWRAARSRGLSRRHPQHLASRFLHVQRAPTARQRSTPALAVRLPAVGMAAVCGRSRNLPSPPKGQPPLPPCDSTSLRARSLSIVVVD